MIFKNKKLLLIAPVFYNYHTSIIKSLKKMGFIVYFIPEKDYSTKRRIKKNINTNLLKNHDNRYLEIEFDKIKNENFDYIFVIRAEIININFMNKLKARYKNSEFFMYQWDSVKNNNYLEIVSYFDKVFTFDREDASFYNINYLPLFYVDEYENIDNNREKDIDILIIASVLGRDKFVSKLIKFSKDNNLNFYHHLYMGKLEYLKSIVKNKMYKNVKFNTLSFKEVIDLYSRTKIIVDYNNVNQSGLTIRTLESLGAGKKLVTSNSFIKKEPFYDKENIFIIDRENPNIDLEFINSKFKKNDIIYNYHIDNFLLNIFKSE